MNDLIIAEVTPLVNATMIGTNEKLTPPGIIWKKLRPIAMKLIDQGKIKKLPLGSDRVQRVDTSEL